MCVCVDSPHDMLAEVGPVMMTRGEAKPAGTEGENEVRSYISTLHTNKRCIKPYNYI